MQSQLHVIKNRQRNLSRINAELPSQIINFNGVNYNLNSGVYAVEDQKAASLNVPQKFVFCINDSCSFRCKMCYNWTNKHKPNLQYKDWVKKLYEINLYKKNDIEINIIGGEPLEISWTPDLISCAKKLGFTVSLSTNAYFVDQEMAKKLVDARLDNISISLDGATAKTHDYIRGVKGAYDKLASAMKFLRAYPKGVRPRIVVQSLIMGINLDELEDIVYFASDDTLVDDGVYMMAIMKPNSPTIGDNWKEEDKFHLWPKDINKAMEKVRMLYAMKSKGYRVLNSNEQLKAFYDYFKSPDSFVKTKSCNVKDFGGFVESTGKVFICREFEELGNTKSKNIIKILNSETSKSVRGGMEKCSKNCNYLINCFYQDENSSSWQEEDNIAAEFSRIPDNPNRYKGN
jgi:MoaA/NifB/PqqE/SkfB family radical SAM enzyme